MLGAGTVGATRQPAHCECGRYCAVRIVNGAAVLACHTGSCHYTEQLRGYWDGAVPAGDCTGLQTPQLRSLYGAGPSQAKLSAGSLQNIVTFPDASLPPEVAAARHVSVWSGVTASTVRR